MHEDLYAEMVTRIVTEQEKIIGPVAIEQAEQVPELHVNWSKHAITISGDGREAINKLVSQYRKFFGNMSVEVCKEAIAKIASQLPPGQLPESLR